MPVKIILDNPVNVWTNLDHMIGKVHLRLDSQSSISSIVVKLEGESRTKLVAIAPGDLNDRPRPHEEYHKLLYETVTVFPPPEISGSSSQKAFTLNAGDHVYPFDFKIPINNSCSTLNPQPMSYNIKNMASTSLRDLGPRPPVAHTRATLPPTLAMFPTADIRYYVKVTVNRKEFYKQNDRYSFNFNFLPIEPPRPYGGPDAETYARRRHDFSAGKQAEPRKGLFASLRGKSSTASMTSYGPPPCVSVDVRLPNPPVLTCNEDIPIRVLVKRINQSSAPIFVHSVQVTLTSKTRVRAQDIQREEANGYMLFSRTNLGMPLNSQPSTNKNTTLGGLLDEEMVVDLAAAGWRTTILPNSIAPSFETCNIRRSYELDVDVGIGWGDKDSASRNHVILPLKHHVQIFSGIKPPPQLLAAISSRPSAQPRPQQPTNFASKLQQTQQSSSSSSPYAASSSRIERKPVPPPRPFDDENRIPHGQHINVNGTNMPTTSIAAQFGAEETNYNEDDDVPPPSYEDALAGPIESVGGQRPVYDPGSGGGGGGANGGGHGKGILR